MDYEYTVDKDEVTVEITLPPRGEDEPRKKIATPSVVGIVERKGHDIQSYKETSEIVNDSNEEVSGKWVFEIPYEENRCADCGTGISKQADRCRSCAAKNSADKRRDKQNGWKKT